MQELKDAGLIIGHEEETKIVYCLDCSKIEEMRNVLEVFLKEIELPHDFCCEFKQKK
jgi:hypothetical protein